MACPARIIQAGSTPHFSARVAELADAAVSSTVAERRASSTLAPGIMNRSERRHHKQRKIASQIRILDCRSDYLGDRDSRVLDRHINCKCMGIREWMRKEDRRRDRVAWRVENAAY